MLKRESPEWVRSVVKIILLHENNTNIDTLYSEIPKYIHLTEHERRLSGIAAEQLWRGTLRGYLSDLVKDGTLKRNYGPRRKPWFSVACPDDWNFLF